MNVYTSRIGFWAALLATIFGLGFIAALIASMAGMLASPWTTFYQVAPSIALAWCYLVLMACILDAAPAERKIWATIGFGLALIYSTINSIVYFTLLTVVIPAILRNEAGSVAVLLFDPGNFLFAVNGLAYALMSISVLFASPVFARPGLESRVRWAMVAHGIIGPFIAGAVVWPPLTYIGGLWIVTFPVMGILLAILFRRAEAR